MNRVLVVLAVVLLVAVDADARVGGGQGFSTGGGGGGFSGGGGGGDGLGLVIYLIIRLCFEHPIIGIPLLIIVLGVLAVRFWWGNRDQARQVHRLRSTMQRAASAPQRDRSTGRSRPEAQLLEQDSGFSEPVLFEFLQLVHRRALDAFGTGEWAGLAPFVADDVKAQLAAAMPGVSRVSDVVHAGVRLDTVRTAQGETVLEVQLLGSRIEHQAKGRSQPMYFEERWTFARRQGAESLAPEETLRMGCPSCGAAVETESDGTCRYCHTPITKGQLQWQARSVTSRVRRPIKPPSVGLFYGGDEPGALVPSVVDPSLGTRYRAFTGRHPDFDQAAFLDRCSGIFIALQAAWSDMEWSQARPFVTDPLYETLRFQIEGYVKHGLVNRMDDVEIERMDVVKVSQDAWYEAITVRVWASARDWTEDGSGSVVGGNKRVRRRFSEYWTFLRASGTGASAHGTKQCPSCGAALDRVNAAGVCGYCESRIVSGRFDWVLSRIDQPEVYQG